MTSARPALLAKVTGGKYRRCQTRGGSLIVNSLINMFVHRRSNVCLQAQHSFNRRLQLRLTGIGVDHKEMCRHHVRLIGTGKAARDTPSNTESNDDQRLLTTESISH